jgi:hypothetical protein
MTHPEDLPQVTVDVTQYSINVTASEQSTFHLGRSSEPILIYEHRLREICEQIREQEERRADWKNRRLFYLTPLSLAVTAVVADIALDANGPGRVEDTYNLLGHALAKALGVIARQQRLTAGGAGGGGPGTAAAWRAESQGRPGL